MATSDGRASETMPLLQARNAQNKPPMLTTITAEFNHAFRAAIGSSSTNILLICVPLGLLGGGWGWPTALIFGLNFLAMLPLASILTVATEQLAAVVGSMAGGLINATFGNAVEMIVRHRPTNQCRQSATDLIIGGNQCIKRRRNYYRTIQYDGEHSILHFVGKPVLALCYCAPAC